VAGCPASFWQPAGQGQHGHSSMLVPGRAPSWRGRWRSSGLAAPPSPPAGPRRSVVILRCGAPSRSSRRGGSVVQRSRLSAAAHSCRSAADSWSASHRRRRWRHDGTHRRWQSWASESALGTSLLVQRCRSWCRSVPARNGFPVESGPLRSARSSDVPRETSETLDQVLDQRACWREGSPAVSEPRCIRE
jgi:hypothetical protein